MFPEEPPHPGKKEGGGCVLYTTVVVALKRADSHGDVWGWFICPLGLILNELQNNTLAMDSLPEFDLNEL